MNPVSLEHSAELYHYARAGPLKLFRHALNRWRCNKLKLCYLCFCNWPIKTRKKERKEKKRKKMFGPGFEPCFPGAQRRTLYHYARAAFSWSTAQNSTTTLEPLVPQGTTNVSYTITTRVSTWRHIVVLLLNITSSCRKTDSKQCYFHILTSQTESKKSSKENMQQIFCDQELQTGTGQDKARSAWKL